MAGQFRHGIVQRGVGILGPCQGGIEDTGEGGRQRESRASPPELRGFGIHYCAPFPLERWSETATPRLMTAPAPSAARSVSTASKATLSTILRAAAFV